MIFFDIQINRFINNPVPSNTFLLRNDNSKSCIVVDPGSKDESELLSFVSENNLQLDYIILTHEHFDHYWGVNHLLENTGAKVVCSSKCAEIIKKPTNYFNKYYFDSEETYSVDRVDIMVEKNEFEMDWEGQTIRFMETKGHTPNGMCISIGDRLFTGDTLLLNTKPVQLKRMGSSKEDLKESLMKIFSSFPGETMVYPGHGEPFHLSEARPFYDNYYETVMYKSSN